VIRENVGRDCGSKERVRAGQGKRASSPGLPRRGGGREEKQKGEKGKGKEKKEKEKIAYAAQ